MNEVNEHNQPHGYWSECIGVSLKGEIHASGEYIKGLMHGMWIQEFYSYQEHTLEQEAILYFNNNRIEGEVIRFCNFNI